MIQFRTTPIGELSGLLSKPRRLNSFLSQDKLHKRVYCYQQYTAAGCLLSTYLRRWPCTASKRASINLYGRPDRWYSLSKSVELRAHQLLRIYYRSSEHKYSPSITTDWTKHVFLIWNPKPMPGVPVQYKLSGWR